MKIKHLFSIKKGVNISRRSLMTLIVCGSGCLAISASQEAKVSNCDSAGPTSEKAACAQTEYDANTKELNKIYQTMQKKIKLKRARDVAQLKKFPDNPIFKNMLQADDEKEKRIVIAERAWIQFRDANCYLVSATDLGGSGEAAENLYCLAVTTKSRIDELEIISEGLFEE